MLKTISIKVKVSTIGTTKPEWAKDVARHLTTRELPEEQKTERKIKSKVAKSTIKEGILFERGFSAPFLCCISKEEAQYVLGEICQDIIGIILAVMP